MKYLNYASKLVHKIAIDFEFWGIYETSLIEAIAGLLIYQLLEDIILSKLKQKE